jgi:hypothetical protein
MIVQLGIEANGDRWRIHNSRLAPCAFE